MTVFRGKGTDKCLDTVETIRDYTSHNDEVKSESSGEFAQDLKELGNIYADIIQKETPPCVTTGFPKLDKLFRGGFPKGTLSILAGRPGHGKTSIGCFMMKQAAQAGFSSVMISLEQKNIDIYEKMMYGTGRITPEDVDRKRIAWSEYEIGVAELEKLPVSLIDIATTIEDILFYIITLNHRGKCDIAFIDYLGLIPVKADKGKTMAQAIGEVTRSLKCLAMQLNIPIVHSLDNYVYDCNCRFCNYYLCICEPLLQ